MSKNRLEAFSDGVIAILITIMVLELKVPSGDTWEDFYRESLRGVFTYSLSFVLLAIYWHNHHHLMHAVNRVTGGVLWANTHLLFWLSLTPFTTAWMEERHFAPIPTAVYSGTLFLSAVAFRILIMVILRQHAPDSPFARAVGADFKGKISATMYLFAIGLAFVQPLLSVAIFAGVGMVWLIPDRRVERMLKDN